MHAATFAKRFSACAAVLATCGPVCRAKNFWSNPGGRPRDLQLSALADLYWDASDDQRQRIRDAVDPHVTWELLAYIRRVAILIKDEAGLQWLRRGLAIAAIENGRSDFRDLIVSLVILRHGAERAGIATRQHFDDGIKAADAVIHGHLKNARDHRESDVTATIREFGPDEWRRRRAT